jgi:putative Mg2+ transporter-C (MgtC) family protein
MTLLSQNALEAYWSAPVVEANLIVFLNLLGSLLLGLLVGYERSYHGRAAGMRTYGLVCMASTALTVIAGYPEFWYGGHVLNPVTPDVTRVIQGIVTGVGFLGAGVIMKEGMSISGLTTAASIWSASAIGVLVGVGFYASAMLLSMLSAVAMMWVTKLETWLPSRHAVAVVLTYRQGFEPSREILEAAMLERGYEIATGSLSINSRNGVQEWRFAAIALNRDSGKPLPAMAQDITKFDGVESFHLSNARN